MVARPLQHSNITKFSKFQTTILYHCCFDWGYVIKHKFMLYYFFLVTMFNYFEKRLSRKETAGNYMFQVNNRNTRTRSEIYSTLTTKTPEWRQWHRTDVFIVNFKHISHRVLVLLLLTLSREMSAGAELGAAIMDWDWEQSEFHFDVQNTVEIRWLEFTHG